MIQSTHKFYHKGTDKQKRADVIVDLRRLEIQKISKWSREEKKQLEDFIYTFERSFNAFKAELINCINKPF